LVDQLADWDGTVYPGFIRKAPEIDVPIEGVRGWLIQDDKRQIVFFDIMPTAVVPPHSHCAQWGLMVEGDMELTIDGVPSRLGKGDWYFIPEGAEHSAKFFSRVNVIDVFDSSDRYKVKG
jgi:quercetin dioxygenase-like cupin family protein